MPKPKDLWIWLGILGFFVYFFYGFFTNKIELTWDPDEEVLIYDLIYIGLFLLWVIVAMLLPD